MLSKRNAFTLVEVLLVIAIVSVVLFFLTRNMSQPRRLGAQGGACLTHLKDISLALHYFQEQHGHFPPAYTVDEKGNRLHSWRTLILPYLDEWSLYNSIDLTKPWDDPANADAYAMAVKVYQCPASGIKPGLTTYLAPVGPDWSFAGEARRSLDDVGEESVLVMEVDLKHAVHWMSPYDFEDADAIPFDAAIEGVHPGSWMVALSNGQVDFIEPHN